MAQIILNPDVENYFVEMAMSDAVNRPYGIADLYEDGHVVILKDYKFDLDYEFLNSIDFTVRPGTIDPDIEMRLQKLQLKWFAPFVPGQPLNRIQKSLVDLFFAGSVERFEYYVRQAEIGYRQACELRAHLFPNYTFNHDISLSYRLTETVCAFQ